MTLTFVLSLNIQQPSNDSLKMSMYIFESKMFDIIKSVNIYTIKFVQVLNYVSDSDVYVCYLLEICFVYDVL